MALHNGDAKLDHIDEMPRDQIEKVVQAYDRFQSYRTVAAELNMPLLDVCTIVERSLVKRGVKVQVRGLDETLARKYYDLKYTDSALARECGVSLFKIRRWRRINGLKRNHWSLPEVMQQNKRKFQQMNAGFYNATELAIFEYVKDNEYRDFVTTTAIAIHMQLSYPWIEGLLRKLVRRKQLYATLVPGMGNRNVYATTKHRILQLANGNVSGGPEEPVKLDN